MLNPYFKTSKLHLNDFISSKHFYLSHGLKLIAYRHNSQSGLREINSFNVLGGPKGFCC